MAQIKTLFSAICVQGRTNVEIAKAMGVSPQSVSKYLSGENLLPIRRRASFERATGVNKIDWWGYEQEVKAARGDDIAQLKQDIKPPALPQKEKKGFWSELWSDDESEALNGA